MTMPSDLNDPTRDRRIALDAANEYMRLSREAYSRTVTIASHEMDVSIAFALQGILRLLIFHTEQGESK